MTTPDDWVHRMVANQPVVSGEKYRALLRDLAAAQSELSSVKAHAEAMAELLDLQLGTQAAGTWEWKRETAPILEAYRAAHPKEGT